MIKGSKHMKTTTKNTYPAFAVLALAWFALAPMAKATPSQTDTNLGTQSLQSNTTALNDTALGYQSLKSNTAGGSNTATGSQTLLAKTTAVHNNATGVGQLVS